MSQVHKDWRKIVSGSNNQGSSYFEIDIAEFWLRIEATEEGNEYLLRLIGDPVEFFAHYERQCTNPEETNWSNRKWVNAKFPDAEQVKKKRRICTDPYWKDEGRSQTRCPWCLLHFQKSKRWYINAIDRSDGKLKLVELSTGTMEDIVKIASSSINEKKYPDGPFSLHGKSPEWVITASKSSSGKVDYLVQKEEGTELSAEDWAAIATAPHNRNAQTDEDKVKLIDLEFYCRPSYMAEDLQIKNFGELVDQVPKKKDDSSKNDSSERRSSEEEAPVRESKVEERSSSDDLDSSISQPASSEDDQDPGW